MTKKEQRQRRKKFLVDGPTILTLCKMDAVDLDLPKTAKALDEATKILGYEIAESFERR